MSQPIEYLGAVSVEANQALTTADILTLFPTATVAKMKTEGVKVSIDSTDFFDISYDEESYVVTGKTYKFNKDCTIAVGIYKTV
jgi:hypothetical protein